MAEELAKNPDGIVEQSGAVEAAFKVKLKEAELYTAHFCQDQRERKVLPIETEGGCSVYSASQLLKALYTISDLPRDQTQELLYLHGLNQISPHWGKRDGANQYFSEEFKTPLREISPGQKEDKTFDLDDHTSIYVEAGLDGDDLFAQVLTDNPEIRALCYGEETGILLGPVEEQRVDTPLRKTSLEEKDTAERKQLILSFLDETKKRSEEGTVNRSGNRMWLIRVTADESRIDLMPIVYWHSSENKAAMINAPLRSAEDQRSGLPCYYMEAHMRVDLGYVAGMMEQLGKNGIRASIDTSQSGGAAYAKSWVTNDDSLPAK